MKEDVSVTFSFFLILEFGEIHNFDFPLLLLLNLFIAFPLFRKPLLVLVYIWLIVFVLFSERQLIKSNNFIINHLLKLNSGFISSILILLLPPTKHYDKILSLKNK